MRLSALFLSLFLTACAFHSPSSQRRPSSFDSLACFPLSQKIIALTYPAQERRLATFHNQSFDLNDYILNNDGSLPKKFAYFSEAQVKATQLNVKEMIGVKRGDGIPYATHPIKLSFLAESILGRESVEAHETFLYTMVHDILEEGHGINIPSYQRMKNLFPESPAASEAAYILVEPDLSALKFPEEVSDKMIEIIGYYRQIVLLSQLKEDRALFNASIIDKLFNVFDRYYAVKSGAVTEEEFTIKMKWRLAKQGFLLGKMEEFAHPDVVAYARSFHNNLVREIGATPREIQELISQYEALDQAYHDQIDELILRRAHEFSIL